MINYTLKLTGMLKIIMLVVLIPQLSKVKAQEMSKDEYFKEAIIYFKNKSGVKVTKEYETMTADEKSSLPAAKSPSIELMNTWKDRSKYLVTIDNGNPSSKQLSDYQPGNFVSYHIAKHIGNPVRGYHDLIYLYTYNYVSSFRGGGRVINTTGGHIELWHDFDQKTVKLAN